MEHPFTQKTELNECTTDLISGAGSLGSKLVERDPRSPTPPVKPELGSTLAIGEEGGGFWY
ncbi:hypothetical protein [Aliiglaciecola sp. LCG003]|uniref:hypothetical protein n=1 Tax=Aliiglaciecola sp. LCG003 TaxID=3053655 RepID=UPI0025743595|nr:hypothetical protein [Aliiglaciecola sp. LCG003]WJG09863.1 hypothetical protein QR722_02170 [Aliiglaciecola sp. LCG003]